MSTFEDYKQEELRNSDLIQHLIDERMSAQDLRTKMNADEDALGIIMQIKDPPDPVHDGHLICDEYVSIHLVLAAILALNDVVHRKQGRPLLLPDVSGVQLHGPRLPSTHG